MQGYAIQLDELAVQEAEGVIFLLPEEVENNYPIPSAFEAYTKFLDIKLGPEK